MKTLSTNRGRVADPLRDRDMLCFSHDWGGDPLSKTHLMRLLARENRVLWVGSLGNRAVRARAGDALRVVRKLRSAARGLVRVEPTLWALTPLYVPAYGGERVRRANRALLRLQLQAAMRCLGMRRPI